MKLYLRPRIFGRAKTGAIESSSKKKAKVPLLRPRKMSKDADLLAELAAGPEAECLVCGDALAVPDRLVPLPCPTPDCTAALCGDCLRGLGASARDDYQTASDGSRQVKTRLQCPLCRGPYRVVLEAPEPTEASESSSKTIVRLDGHQILRSVLVLREAHGVLRVVREASGSEKDIQDYPAPLTVDDSALTSTQLAAKDAFCRRHAWRHLAEAHADYSVYRSSLPHAAASAGSANVLRHLEPLRPLLRGDPDSNLASESSEGAENRPLTDPTLFLGLDELLAPEEQAFCSQLLVGNDLHGVHQACLILQGMLQVPVMRSTPLAGARSAAAERRHYRNLDQIRKRYPLPAHMPRCVRLVLGGAAASAAAADCLRNRKHFVPIKDPATGVKTPSLELRVVRGPAGAAGLRRGDLLTHLDGEPVASFEELQAALEGALRANHDGTVLVGVNICAPVAAALRDRNLQMRRDGVRFEYR